MRFGDLPAEHQADAGAAWLGGEVGHEEVGRIGDAGAVVGDLENQLAAVAPPGDFHRPGARLLERGFGGVRQQVLQQLLQLVGIRVDRPARVRRPTATGTRASPAASAAASRATATGRLRGGGSRASRE